MHSFHHMLFTYLHYDYATLADVEDVIPKDVQHYWQFSWTSEWFMKQWQWLFLSWMLNVCVMCMMVAVCRKHITHSCKIKLILVILSHVICWNILSFESWFKLLELKNCTLKLNLGLILSHNMYQWYFRVLNNDVYKKSYFSFSHLIIFLIL